MKPSRILLVCATILVAGIIVYLMRQEEPLPPAPFAELASGKATVLPARIAAPKDEPVATASSNLDDPSQVPVVNPTPSDTKTGKQDTPSPFSQAIAVLVSPQTSFPRKQAAWKQLRDAGQLDQAIEALRQGAAENPTAAAYPAALGQAQLQKAGVIAENGGAINEMGILGMQADQNFDVALKLDPANWEAQFFKAAAMSYWPLELNKGEEVIQRLSRLIDQQEKTSPQAEFVQTYVLLGDQYHKMGKSDYAAATWQLGAVKFPNDPTLQERIRER